VGSESHVFEKIVKKACLSLVQAEPEITRLDSVAGDGDCGLTLKGGAEGNRFIADVDNSPIFDLLEATLEAIKNGLISGADILRSVLEISRIAEEKMGGTSGALYS
jgi:dihydroxyacetone kinase